jgi:hypothetical protein
MLFRKKTRFRLLLLLVVAAVFIYWRGFNALARQDFNCKFKLFIAACVPKTKDAKLPNIMDAFKAGLKF